MKTLREKRQEFLKENLNVTTTEDEILLSLHLEKQDKQFIKEIIDEIEEINSPLEKKNYIDRIFNNGFENMRKKVIKIIKTKSGFKE